MSAPVQRVSRWEVEKEIEKQKISGKESKSLQGETVEAESGIHKQVEEDILLKCILELTLTASSLVQFITKPEPSYGLKKPVNEWKTVENLFRAKRDD